MPKEPKEKRLRQIAAEDVWANLFADVLFDPTP